jgi:hypothetical protein
MHLLSIPTIVSLLVAFPFATQVSSSVPKLERRHKSHAPYTNVYMMRQDLDYSQGPLPIYTSEGTIAFLFVKSVHNSRKGDSTAKLMSNTSVPILELSSVSLTRFVTSNHLKTAR